MDSARFRQPNPDWPWTMCVRGDPPEDIAHCLWPALQWLSTDGNSCVILKQAPFQGSDEAQHPEKYWVSEEYWYLQCNRSDQVPFQGQYFVRCGYPEESGEVMLVRYFAKLEEAAALFQQALQYEPVDLDGFMKFVCQEDGSWKAADDTPH